MTETRMRRTRHGMMSRRRGGKRRGFILMEVIVAMTLLALIMTPLAAMVFKITARSHRSIGNTYRNAVVMQEINLLESLAYDSLPAGTTTTVVTAKPYPYTKTVTVAQYYQKWQLRGKTVLLVITPANPLYRPDTIKFIRSSANTNKALLDDLQ
ncbi:MAG TPA: prepilin-type N-terminal cleavage/methylation domain-containing protein [Gemmatimonadaceae bacterium]